MANKTLDQLGESFANFNPVEDDSLLGVVQNWGNELAQQMRINLRVNGTNASSALDGSISVLAVPTAAGFDIKVEMEKYWQYVEYGRRPGKMPPIQSIYEWIQNKRSMQFKIKNAKNRITATKSLAFVIARKIGAKGTPKQPFVQPALQKVTVATLIERMESYIVDSLEG